MGAGKWRVVKGMTVAGFSWIMQNLNLFAFQ